MAWKMERRDTVGKDMMLKLKESFSLKSFSSRRYHSSLICNSKTIRMDGNLIGGGKVLTSTSAFTGWNFTVRNSGNVSEKNRETSKWHEKNSENSEVKNKSAESSSFIKKSPKSENMKELLKIGNSTSEDGRIKLIASVKHSYEAKIYGSFNQIQTKAKPDCSKFEPFRCDVCMKYFSSESYVKRHRKIHSLERHPCETCGKVFRSKESLKIHCNLVHGVKVRPFQCSECYKAFSRKERLNAHLKKHL